MRKTTQSRHIAQRITVSQRCSCSHPPGCRKDLTGRNLHVPCDSRAATLFSCLLTSNKLPETHRHSRLLAYNSTISTRSSWMVICLQWQLFLWLDLVDMSAGDSAHPRNSSSPGGLSMWPLSRVQTFKIVSQGLLECPEP